jgi:general secretion pathway protein D
MKKGITLIAVLTVLFLFIFPVVFTENLSAFQISKKTQKKTTEGEREISLYFDDADIYEVIHTIFGEILKVNYLVDPKVRGRITFRSVKPIKKENLLPVISTIFRLNGIGIMEENGLYRIIPLEQSIHEPVDIEFGRSPDDLKIEGKTIIQIIPLNFVTASEMKQILEPFLSKGATIAEVPNKNCLIVSDTDENIRRLLKIVQTFDDELFRDIKVKMFVIKNFNVRDVLENLQAAFPIFVTTDRESLKIRFIPIEKLNAVLVVAPSEKYLKEIEKWIEILDSTFESARPKIYVYPLQNSKAEHVAQILQQLFLSTGVKGTIKRTATKITKTKTKQKTTRSSTIKRTTSSKPTISSPLEEPLVTPGTKIFADEITNSLIILTTPRDYSLIEDVIKKLDVVPRQVLIEAIIAEVSLTDELQFGVEWFLKSHFTLDNTSLKGFTVSGAPTLAFDPTNPLSSAGFTFAAVDSADTIRGLLQALSTKSELNVLSSPHILVSDNREAKIQVGNQVPIVTSETNVTGTTNIQRTIQYRDTGVILKVKPQINEGGLVALDISQEVSDVRQPITEGVESPVIFTRSTETNLVVRDGQSIILGGLIQENNESTREGVPLLSDIPLLGYLFGYTKTTKKRTELIVIITPHVIKNISEADTITEDFQRKLKNLQKLLKENKKNENQQNPADTAPTPSKAGDN